MQLSPKIALGGGPHGQSVVCMSALVAHERLLSLIGLRVAAPGKYTIQVDEQEHIEPAIETLWAYSNHDCDPNCSIDFTSWELVTRRPVGVGEEITFNYLSTEWDLSTPFDCACGAPHCYRQIRGFRYLTEPQRRTLSQLLSPFLASRAAMSEAIDLAQA